MPNPIIQSYFNDTDIPKEYRNQVFNDLHNGKVDETSLVSALTKQYPGKYQGITFGGGAPADHGVGGSWGDSSGGQPMAQSKANPIPQPIEQPTTLLQDITALPRAVYEGVKEAPSAFVRAGLGAAGTIAQGAKNIDEALSGDKGIINTIKNSDNLTSDQVKGQIGTAAAQGLSGAVSLIPGLAGAGGVISQVPAADEKLKQFQNYLDKGVTEGLPTAIPKIESLLGVKLGPEAQKGMGDILRQLVYLGTFKAGEAAAPLLEDLSKAVPGAVEKTVNTIQKVGENPTVQNIPGKLSDIATGIADKTSNFLQDLRNAKIVNETTKAQEQLPKIIDKGIEKGIRPSVVGKNTPTQMNAFKAKAADAIQSIVNNKPNLSFTSPEGLTINGELPKNLNQFTDAIDQTKRNIFQKYDSLAKSAGETGITVDLNPVVKELRDFANSPDSVVLQDKHPQILDYAKRLADTLEKRGNYTPGQIQDAIAMYNQDLKTFYKNPTPGSFAQAGVDAMVANKMRSALDNAVSTSDTKYQTLKNEYGALSSIEKDVAHRAIVANRAAPVGFVQQFANIGTGFELVKALAHLDPSALATAGVIKGISLWNKYLNDPNVIIKKMFEGVEKANAKIQPLNLEETQNAKATTKTKSNSPISKSITSKRSKVK